MCRSKHRHHYLAIHLKHLGAWCERKAVSCHRVSRGNVCLGTRSGSGGAGQPASSSGTSAAQSTISISMCDQLPHLWSALRPEVKVSGLCGSTKSQASLRRSQYGQSLSKHSSDAVCLRRTCAKLLTCDRNCALHHRTCQVPRARLRGVTPAASACELYWAAHSC